MNNQQISVPIVERATKKNKKVQRIHHSAQSSPHRYVNGAPLIQPSSLHYPGAPTYECIQFLFLHTLS